MRSIVYTERGGPDVLRVVARPTPEPGPGEVLVRVHRSGVNPTDWKARAGSGGVDPPQVPNQDGSGVVGAVGPGVDPTRVGERVWLWEAAYERPNGTAQDYVALPEAQAVPLPADVPFDLGASLGIAFLTAHRALTVSEGGPDRLTPGALAGRAVLVAGGAGAVGNAAIQLARWAGATVLTTVSGPEKGSLATAAGAHHVIDYRRQDVVAAVRAVAPPGVDAVVEVAPGVNADIDVGVVAVHGTVAVYATDGGDDVRLPVRPLMGPNARWQFVLVYTEPVAAKQSGVAAVSAAVADGAVRVGPNAGLPITHFPLERIGEAHEAVRTGTVGKVLVDLT
jgi:NADPH:quinone reductase